MKGSALLGVRIYCCIEDQKECVTTQIAFVAEARPTQLDESKLKSFGRGRIWHT